MHTAQRGATPIEDAKNIKELLNSVKEESELTMCTDVDRNDKSRICVPGSVKVLGRRQIEMYSKLIHTVDHVEGTLRCVFRMFSWKQSGGQTAPRGGQNAVFWWF
jgi:anthranilate synthase